MRMLIGGFLVAAIMVGPVAAKEAANASSAARDVVATTSSPTPRVVYVCDRSSMTRRAFAREHGQAEFVTAEVAARRGEAWASPKCMSESEARRLRRLQAVASR